MGMGLGACPAWVMGPARVWALHVAKVCTGEEPYMEQAGMELNLHGGWASMRLGLHGDQAYVGEGPAWGLGLHRGGDLCGGGCALGWACMGERHAGAQVYVEMGLHGGAACI